MAGKIKGIYKGFKSISQIFVVKERKMEIGQPTDVIHVAHIGVDHSSTVAPTWMNEFKIGPDKTTKSSDDAEVSHPTALSTRSSQGIGRSRASELKIKKMRNRSCIDLPNVMEKRKRRRKSTSITEFSFTKSRGLSKTRTTSTELGSSSDSRT